MLLLHLNVTKNLSVCWHVLIRFVDNYSVLALLFTATLFVAYMYGCLSYKIGVQTMLRQSYQLFLVALFATAPTDVVVFFSDDRQCSAALISIRLLRVQQSVAMATQPSSGV